MEKQESAILYGVPKVAYGQDGCTPFPICIRSCGTYLGFAVDYTRAMAESGAAFRLTWDTACWNGGNVDAILTFDHPAKVFRCGMRAMERNLKLLRRTPETKKEDFMAFIRREIDAGNPVGLGTVPQEGAANITPAHRMHLSLCTLNSPFVSFSYAIAVTVSRNLLTSLSRIFTRTDIISFSFSTFNASSSFLLKLRCPSAMIRIFRFVSFSSVS